MKKLLYIFLLTMLTVPSMAQSYAASAVDTIETSILADRIIETAQQYIGRPYHYGSQGPKSFDCSGFTGYVFAQYGIKLDRTSAGQGQQGRPVEEGFENLQKGDLVLFSRRGHSVGHVGIFIERDTARNSFKFIHAATHGGVMISNYYEQYYKAHYRFARRILPDFDSYELGEGDYPFDSVAYLRPDELRLDSADLRIVLFGNGRWAYLSESGELSIPQEEDRIMLSADGRWAKARKSVSKAANVEVREEKPVVAPAETDSAVAEAPVQAAPVEPEKQYYTVKKGDTLYQIAKRHGTTVNAICRLNGIKENTVLQVNRRLRVK